MAWPEPNICSQKCGNGVVAACASMAIVSCAYKTGNDTKTATTRIAIGFFTRNLRPLGCLTEPLRSPDRPEPTLSMRNCETQLHTENANATRQGGIRKDYISRQAVAAARSCQ